MDLRARSDVVALLVTAAMAAAIAACDGAPATPAARRPLPPSADPSPQPGFAADLDHGARLYAAHCARCHGAHGAGDGVLAVGLSPAPTDWTAPGALRDRTPRALFLAVRRGVLGTSMQRFDAVLDEAATWDVVFHVWSLADDDAARQHAAEAYARACSACHGDAGIPAPAAAGPSLVRPAWVGLSRDALADRVAEVHPSLAAGDRAAASAHIWTFLTAGGGRADPSPSTPAASR